MNKQEVAYIILAAGKGSRLKSDTAKVMHTIAGKSMLSHLIDNITQKSRFFNKQQKSIFVVVHHNKNQIIDSINATYNKDNNQNNPQTITFIEQLDLQGTASAVKACLPAIANYKKVVILYGDVPFVAMDTVDKMLEQTNTTNPLTLLTATYNDPTGYGRIVRKDNTITSIVEHKDATSEQLLINEINSGIMACDVAMLNQQINLIGNNNAQNEYYLTDLVKLVVTDQKNINAICVTDYWQVFGINDAYQLSQAEKYYQEQQAIKLLKQGVRIKDYQRFDLRGELITGTDVTIDINCIFIGKVVLGNNVNIAANCILTNCEINDNSEVFAMSHIEESRIANNCSIGPYARIRPNSNIASGCRIGNFVEIKKSQIQQNSKVNHLSYIGDAQIGKEVNIGAGVITCNYDGTNKHTTTINNNSFIGSNSSLVAPVEIGKSVMVAAGSTITKSVATGLAIARSKQKTIAKWKKDS